MARIGSKLVTGTSFGESEASTATVSAFMVSFLADSPRSRAGRVAGHGSRLRRVDDISHDGRVERLEPAIE
jgi:hypothetical protein